MKRNKRNTGRSAKKNDRYSCEIDTAWFDGANYESNSIIHGAFGQVCSRIFSSRIKGRGQDEVCGRHEAPRVWIFEPVLGGRLYSRPWTFHSVNVPWYRVNGFPSFHFRPEIFSARFNACYNLCVYALFTGEEKIIEIIGGYRETCRRCYCMILLKFLWENQDINFDRLLVFLRD